MSRLPWGVGYVSYVIGSIKIHASTYIAIYRLGYFESSGVGVRGLKVPAVNNSETTGRRVIEF